MRSFKQIRLGTFSAIFSFAFSMTAKAAPMVPSLRLKFLQTEGLPLEVTKLILFNGGISDFTPIEGLINKVWKEVSENTSLSFESVMEKSKGATEGLATALLFASFDVDPRDGKISGPKEWEKLENFLVNQLETQLKKVLPESAIEENQEFLDRIKKSGVLKVGLVLYFKESIDIEAILKKQPINIRPTNFLQLLEEILRRSVPVEQLKNEIEKVQSEKE